MAGSSCQPAALSAWGLRKAIVLQRIQLSLGHDEMSHCLAWTSPQAS